VKSIAQNDVSVLLQGGQVGVAWPPPPPPPPQPVKTTAATSMNKESKGMIVVFLLPNDLNIVSFLSTQVSSARLKLPMRHLYNTSSF